MTTSIRNAAATAGLLAALCLPLAANAATTNAPPQRYTMHTQYFDRWHAGEYDGVLALRVYPSGIVQGTYRDADAGGFKTVAGGIDQQNHIWLDIGNGVHPLRLYGTFKDGVLRTTANIPGGDDHYFQSVSVAKAF